MLKVTKNQGFTLSLSLSLEDTFLEKPQGEVNGGACWANDPNIVKDGKIRIQ